MNIKNIINGWGNYLRSKTIGNKNYIEAQAKQRAEICKACPLNVADVCSPKDTNHIITNEPVKGCGCPIGPKTMSKNDSCPMGKWGAMANEEVWDHTIALSHYDKVTMFNKDLGHDIVLYNQKDEGVFKSKDSLLVYPYLTMGFYASKGALKTMVIIDATEVLEFEDRAKVFIAKDSFINLLKSSEMDGKNIVLWIPKVMAPDYVSLNAMQNAANFCMQDLANKTARYVQYIYTLSYDSAEFYKHLDRFSIYYEASKLPTKLQDYLNQQTNDN